VVTVAMVEFVIGRLNSVPVRQVTRVKCANMVSQIYVFHAMFVCKPISVSQYHVHVVFVTNLYL